MGAMHKELFEHSPLLVLPLIAMFLFLLVWVSTAIHALTRSHEEMDAAARIPLDEEKRHGRV